METCLEVPSSKHWDTQILTSWKRRPNTSTILDRNPATHVIKLHRKSIGFSPRGASMPWWHQRNSHNICMWWTGRVQPGKHLYAFINSKRPEGKHQFQKAWRMLKVLYESLWYFKMILKCIVYISKVCKCLHLHALSFTNITWDCSKPTTRQVDRSSKAGSNDLE